MTKKYSQEELGPILLSKKSNEFYLALIENKQELLSDEEFEGIVRRDKTIYGNNKEEVGKKCIARCNNENFIKRLKEVFIPYYEDSIKRNYDKLYILNDKGTLEGVLKKENII